MRNWIILGIVVGVIIYLKRRYGQDNEMQAEMRAQAELRQQGKIATAAGQAASDSYPLAMIGDTPLAGIWLDPFNANNPASLPKRIDTYPSSIFLN